MKREKRISVIIIFILTLSVLGTGIDYINVNAAEYEAAPENVVFTETDASSASVTWVHGGDGNPPYYYYSFISNSPVYNGLPKEGDEYFNYYVKKSGTYATKRNYSGLDLSNRSYYVYVIAVSYPSWSWSSETMTRSNPIGVTYSVKFSDCDGTVLKETIVGINEEIIVPEPTKAGYTFAGWYEDSALTTPFDFASNKVAVADMNVYAKWDARTDTPYIVEHYQQNLNDDGYTVFETENFTGTTENEVTASVKNYTGFVAPTSPVKGTIVGDGSLTLKLYYNRDEYTVTFKDWDGAELKTEAVKYQRAATAPNPTRTGYIFAGWDVDFSNVTSDFTVTAQYTINQYTVSFNSNGGSSVGGQTLDYNSLVSEPPAPTRAGYNFVGWYKDLALTLQWDFASDRVGAADVTLYAKWEPRTDTAYKVEHYQQNLNDDGYTVFETENFTGTTESEVTASVKNYTGFVVPTSEVKGTIVGDGSLTLKLYYDRKEYTVAFKDWDGADLKTEAVKYQRAATAPPAPTRDGYNFVGWYKDLALTLQWDFASDRVGAADITLYAKWDPRTDTPYKVEHYKQNLNDDGYTKFETEDFTGTTDSEVTASVKAYTGFVAPTSEVKGTIVGDGSLVLKLYYDRDEYTVTFKDWDGADLKTEAVKYERTATAPVPNRIGYTFTSWDVNFSNVTSDLTVKAQYTINQYTVSFNSNGGSSVGGQTLNYNSSVSEPLSPLKDDYDFAGWYKEPEFKNEWKFGVDTIPANNITLYAKWVPSQDTITMVANPSSVEANDSFNQIFTLNINNDQVISTISNADISLGGVFSGLNLGEISNNDVTVTVEVHGNLDSAGTGVITLNQDKLLHRTSPLSADIIVTPKPTYTVMYNSNGAISGSVPIDNNHYEAGTTVIVEDNTGNLVKTGYKLTGWNTSQDGSGTNYQQGDAFIMGNSNITLYGQWTIEQFSVIFADYYGRELKQEIVDYGNSATQPEAPTEEGYTFTGWDKDFSNVKSDLIIFAQCNINQYTVSFETNGGSSIDSRIVDYNTKVAVPSEPYRRGYYLRGWYEDKELTKLFDFNSPVVKDKTLYVRWSRIVDEDDDSKPNSEESTSTEQLENSIVIVNDQEEKAGIESITEELGEKIVEVRVDSEVINKKIAEIINSQSQNTGEAQEKNKIEVPISTQDAKEVATTLTGDLVKKMDDNDFDLSITSNNVNYVIPAKEVGIENVAQTLGVATDQLKEIKVEVKINKADEELTRKIEESAKLNDYELVFPSVKFEVVAKTKTTTGKEKEVTVSKFKQYVQREMRIPEDVNPSKITTGIVFNEDGTFSHVPTKVFIKDGVYYAKLNSLTNSSYSVIWNPVNVKSVENHWAKEAVNDMASRLVIKNPNTFMPDEDITRGEFAEYITKALGLYRTGVAEVCKFTDVELTHELADAIEIATQYGVISGYPDGTFRPNALISREEAMVMYARAMNIVGLKEIDNSRIEKFTDKEEVAVWAYNDVKKTVSVGIFKGKTTETINPKDTFTYAEAATAVKNLLLASGLIN